MSPVDDDDEAPVRMTRVHCRFEVHGYIGGEPELVETFQRRADADRFASRIVGPGQYERAEVYDAMAHKAKRPPAVRP